MKLLPIWLLVGAVGVFGGIYAAGYLPTAAEANTQASPAERAQMKAALANDPGVPSVVPKGYDATIVVFSDYQCPYCRKMHMALKQVLASDHKVRVVYRDWPIFGAPSLEAARTALAARYQGKHAAFNDALMAGPVKLDHDAIRQAASRAGVDWPRLQTDLKRNASAIDASLRRTGQLAGTLGLSGTPALVIGDYLIPGAVDAGALRGALQKARQQAR